MRLRRPVEIREYDAESLAINARQVRFCWDGVPLEYIPGDSYATQFWNTMHLVLPEGERAMADVFARALPAIDDERLHEEVVGFVGQEATHAAAHESFRHYLAAQGVDVVPLVARIEYIVHKIFGDHGLTGPAASRWLAERLGIYAAAEHFTAVVGEWLLDNCEFDRRSVDPTMLDLLRWHGSEELEHRNVAFDAFSYIDGNYWRRGRTALIACLGLLVLWFATTADLYRQAARGRRLWWPLAYLRAARRGLVPGLSFLITQTWYYLQPGFHPSQMGDIDKAARYLAQSPAARAARA
ncbi:metal-dependent hydrolase [[Mycobacterium] nativiensis]|uniref:Metal-dependent hydrolase n=1 Tax=[Mycobacterium] nativiensis TaxID=2855503 RepID=A0ABU5XVW7_9MYCO|nr:metal-dependent hydrolase [Mycolicibacter sp. MYC340]MEB3031887.1 metal-dependent hydrolase [Mycolicibacter sp. MYC340]